MTAVEINNEFDLLYNNLSSNAAPPLDPYEKSIFLTQAQDELTVTYYNGYNSRLVGFESTEETSEYLDKLVREQVTDLSDVIPESSMGFKRYIVNKPDDVLFIVREHAIIDGTDNCVNTTCIVNPVTQDNLNRVIRDPYKLPNKRKVLRCNVDNKLHLYSSSNLSSYNVTYLKKPNPIILVPLNYNTDETIDGISDISGSTNNPLEMPDVMIRKIIKRAVELAKVAYIGDLTATLSVNQRTQ